jgi:TonB family protein
MKTKISLGMLGMLLLSLQMMAQAPEQASHRNYEVKMTREAEYPGGNTALYQYLAANMKYPEEAKAQKIQGDIMVSFFVEADSSTSEVRALKDLGAGTKEEAERIVKTLKFSPAAQNGKPIRQQMMLPVLFRIYD